MTDPDTVGKSIIDTLLRENAAVNAMLSDMDEELQKALDAEWVCDPQAAARFSQTHVRKPGHAPHWLRCEFMRNGLRCMKGEGHEKLPGKVADHQEPQE